MDDLAIVTMAVELARFAGDFDFDSAAAAGGSRPLRTWFNSGCGSDGQGYRDRRFSVWMETSWLLDPSVPLTEVFREYRGSLARQLVVDPTQDCSWVTRQRPVRLNSPGPGPGSPRRPRLAAPGPALHRRDELLRVLVQKALPVGRVPALAPPPTPAASRRLHAAVP